MTLPALVWKASPNFSSRGGSGVTRLVLHDCQGSYLGSIATFLGNNGGNPVSAHFVLKEDGSEATQMVALAEKAWHACDANPYSIGVEMAGFAERGYSDSELDNAAAIFAFLAQRLNVPLVHAVSSVYAPGISSHFDLGKFGGGHADPSVQPSFMPAFIARVAAIKDVPASWPGLHDGLSPAPAPPQPVPACPPVNPRYPDVTTIRGLQQALRMLGYNITVDGDYGHETTAAITSFQMLSNIVADGRCGPQTEGALNKALGSMTYKALPA